MDKLYLLDANVFIQAQRVSYPLDVMPSFWAKLKDLAERDLIVSLDKVRDEIYQQEDELCEWCKENLPAKFWLAAENSAPEYAEVVRWAAAQTQRYRQSAIDEFLGGDVADAFLIAASYADIDNRTLVTYEVSSGKIGRIKIPDACVAMGIRFLKPVDMLREIGETL